MRRDTRELEVGGFTVATSCSVVGAAKLDSAEAKVGVTTLGTSGEVDKDVAWELDEVRIPIYMGI
jgi:hypothetical protein